MQPATRSSNQPLGDTSGDWRRRLLRHHVPLALASAVILVLFMTLPPFDPQVYPQMAMMDGGVFPQQAEIMGHGGDQAGSMDQGEGQTGTTGHSGGQTGLMDQGSDQTGTTGHGGDQAGSMDPNEMMEGRQGRFFTQRFTVATA